MAGPLRTGRDKFPFIRLRPFERPFRGARLGDEKTLAVNPIVALWMNQNAVICTRGTTLHPADAVTKTQPVIRVMLVLHAGQSPRCV